MNITDLPDWYAHPCYVLTPDKKKVWLAGYDPNFAPVTKESDNWVAGFYAWNDLYPASRDDVSSV